MVLAPQPNATAATSFQTATTPVYAKWKYAPGQSTNAQNPLHMKSTAKTKYILPVDRSQLMGGIAADPAAQWYWHLSFAGAFNAGGADAYWYTVELIYYVEFFNPVLIGLS